jgi:hypothetical protein
MPLFNETGQSPYSYYLDLLGSWPTGIALASQWFLYFDFNSIGALSNNFQTVLRTQESQAGWEYDVNSTKYLLDGSLQWQTNNLTGCVFTRQVNLPNETINASNEGLKYGGFLPPATSSNREKYQSLGVTFLETNASFLDLIIRPWIISVGYYGLVARGPQSPKNVKCNFADVVMLAKTGSYSPMGIRKIYRFYNIAPISIQGETYSYAEEGLKYSEVKFVYDRYAISDGNTGTFITLP